MGRHVSTRAAVLDDPVELAIFSGLKITRLGKESWLDLKVFSMWAFTIPLNPMALLTLALI